RSAMSVSLEDTQCPLRPKGVPKTRSIRARRDLLECALKYPKGGHVIWRKSWSRAHCCVHAVLREPSPSNWLPVPRGRRGGARPFLILAAHCQPPCSTARARRDP